MKNLIYPLIAGLLSIQSYGALTSTGVYYHPRAQTCRTVTATSSTKAQNSSSTCMTFNWADYQSYATTYTTFTDLDTQKSYTVYLATLPVSGSFSYQDAPNLTFSCPPDAYNGFYYSNSYCKTSPNVQIMFFYIGATDKLLYGYDVVLSGAPFPSTLKENQPPFGVVRFNFTTGIDVTTAGSFQVCDTGSASSSSCPRLQDNSRSLKLKGEYSATGIFQAGSTTLGSQWFMSSEKRLLGLNAGPQVFFFNGTGFWFYTGTSCMWVNTCNFDCEVYNYDSRFLDYIGVWNVTQKKGSSTVNLKVEAWAGNAIDAAGVFPIIMFMETSSNLYIGLDKADPTSTKGGGAAYWYPSFTTGFPDFTKMTAGSIESLKCNATTDEWMIQPKSSGIVNTFFSFFALSWLLIISLL